MRARSKQAEKREHGKLLQTQKKHVKTAGKQQTMPVTFLLLLRLECKIIESSEGEYATTRRMFTI